MYAYFNNSLFAFVPCLVSRYPYSTLLLYHQRFHLVKVNYGYISVRMSHLATSVCCILCVGTYTRDVVETSIKIIVFRDPTRRTYLILVGTLLPGKS